MNTRFLRWLLSVTVFFCMIFIATNVAAKKPSPNTDDPCSELTSFSPDFAFYRDTGKAQIHTFTFFVADAENGCEIKLVDFTGLNWNTVAMSRALSFSSTKEDNGSYLGRIVWRNLLPGNLRVVWGYDFSINGTDVGDIRGPYKVMDNSGEPSENMTHMDLSPDRKTLAYHIYITGVESSIRMVNIDHCVDNPCTSFSENGLVLANATPLEEEYLATPAWGPLGDRVYYRRRSGVEPSIYKLQFVDLPTGWDGDWSNLALFEPAESTLVSTLEQPDFSWFSEIASGIIDDGIIGEREILTVRIPTDNQCGYISFIDVATCEGEESENACLVEPMFFGNNPSWTRQGNVIHNYYREGARNCTDKFSGTVGNYDGTEVMKVLSGFMPDAAGGIPWQ